MNQSELFATGKQQKQLSREAVIANKTALEGAALAFANLLLGSLEPLTANEIADRYKGNRYSTETLRKRAKQLVEQGVIVECEARQCRVTGNRATTYKGVR